MQEDDNKMYLIKVGCEDVDWFCMAEDRDQ